MKVIIVGGGIGGLTTALMLHARGIDCELFEQAEGIRELGVGINTLPHAIRELKELGLLERLDAVGRVPRFHPRSSRRPRPRSRCPSSTRPRLPGGPGATTRGVAIGTGIDDKIAGRLTGQNRWPATHANPSCVDGNTSRNAGRRGLGYPMA